jgi:DNA-directed RNA polymerase specialized sigma24 family protein
VQPTDPARRDGRRADAARALSRADHIARLYADSAADLQRYVAAATCTDEQTIEDACSHAWAQLLSHPSIDLHAARWSLLRWLTTTATREAWRLHELRRLAARADIDGYTGDLDRATPSAEDIAALRARLDLVREIPERPRRFLLRLMLGYSYDEISAQENATDRTTRKQITRARRLLRDLAARENAD